MLKASASPLLHYLSGLLSFCWVIYELQTGGPAREEERREEREAQRDGVMVRGGGREEVERLKVRTWREKKKEEEKVIR